LHVVYRLMEGSAWLGGIALVLCSVDFSGSLVVDWVAPRVSIVLRDA